MSAVPGASRSCRDRSRMIRRAIIPLLVAVCGIAACGSPEAPPRVDAARGEMAPDARPATTDDAASADPVRSAPIEDARARAVLDDTLALADDVAALGDPDALAFAALLRDSEMDAARINGGAGPPSTIDAQVRRWRDEAERRGGSEITTLLMLLYLERGDTPRKRALVARWRRLEPHNLAPLLYDAAPGTDLLAAASATTVADAHYDDVLRAVVDALSRAASPTLSRLQAAESKDSPEGYKLTLAMAFWTTAALPPTHRITAPCREQPLASQRRAQCLHIARVLWHRSDIIVLDMVGTAMVRRLSDAAEEKAAAEAFRNEYAWLSSRITEAYRKDNRAYARRFMQGLFATPDVTERGMMRLLVAEAGFPPAPPPGWRPESP